MNPDYGLWIQFTHRDNFGRDRLKMDQDLPQLYTDNFSSDALTNNASAQILDKVYLRRIVIAFLCTLPSLCLDVIDYRDRQKDRDRDMDIGTETETGKSLVNVRKRKEKRKCTFYTLPSL